jgi:outer membrane protein OmpA-like peptidoglycan-associated protein
MTREAGTAAFAPRVRGVSSGVSFGAMRRVAVPLAVPLATALLGLTTPARAQVTIDLHALEALPREAARPAPRPSLHHRSTPRVRTPATAEARTPAPAVAEPPTVAANPAPAQVATAPAAPVSLPSVAAAPPPPATVAALPAAPPPPSALAAAMPAVPPTATPPSPAPNRTLRVRFAPGESDLTAPEAGAVAGLAHAAPRSDTTSFEVAAYAPAAGGDASSARRLSLARALAIRASLVSAGVPAASIYVRALGAPPASEAGEPNRAIITVMGANGSAAAPKQAKQP